MESVRRWPPVHAEDRDVVDLMQELLETTEQTAGELLARAEELRANAGATDIAAYREAWLALAARYEESAAARLAST